MNINDRTFKYTEKISVICDVCGKTAVCHEIVTEVDSALYSPMLPSGWRSLRADGYFGILVCDDHAIKVEIDGKAQEYR